MKLKRAAGVIVILIASAIIFMGAGGLRTTLSTLFNDNITWNTEPPVITALPAGATIGGTTPAAGTFTDVALQEETTGGNAGATNTLQGVLQLYCQALGTMTSQVGTDTVSYLDDSPTGEWSDRRGAGSVTLSVDTTKYKKGTNSIKVVWESASLHGTTTTADGIRNTVTNDDWTNAESIGFWIMSSIALDAGDLVVSYKDGTQGTSTVNVRAIPAANRWYWYNGTLTATAANKDDVDEIIIYQSTHKHGTYTTWLNGMYIWDDADELALDKQIMQDGALNLVTWLQGTSSVNSTEKRSLYTDYLINYGTTTTDNAIVPIVDMSNRTGLFFYNWK